MIFFCAVVPLWGGTAGQGFLRLGAGVRGMSMGGACSATGDDANTLFCNPAGLARLEAKSLTLMHATHIGQSFYDFAAYGEGGRRVGWGVGAQYFSAGAVDQLDTIGNKTGTFTPGDEAALVGLAFRTGEFQWGLTAKYLQSKLFDTAATFTGDAGFLTPWYLKDRMRFAAAASNVAGKIRYDAEDTDLPRLFRAGGLVRLTTHWDAAVDGVFPSGEDGHVAAGTEYRLEFGKKNALALRAGYDGRQSGNGSGLNVGLGFRLNHLSVDYGFVTLGDFDPSHLVSLGFQF